MLSFSAFVAQVYRDSILTVPLPEARSVSFRFTFMSSLATVFYLRRRLKFRPEVSAVH